MKKMLLFVNPAAGREEMRGALMDVISRFTAAGYEVTCHPTQKPHDISEVIRDRGGQFDMIVACGGDGTLNETVTGLMHLNKKPKPLLGYIPTGTVNDFATSLHIPKTIPEAVENIISGVPFPVDMGGFNDQYFTYVAAFGAFTEVSYVTPQDQKKMLGHLAYVLQGMQQLGRIESIHTRVTYDGGAFEGELLYGSMSNSTSVAGFVRLPETMVHLGDGESELVLVRDPGNVAAFAELVTSVLSERFDSENLLILQTRSASFHFDRPVAWTRDGEAGGEYTDIALRNCPRAVRMIF